MTVEDQAWQRPLMMKNPDPRLLRGPRRVTVEDQAWQRPLMMKMTQYSNEDWTVEQYPQQAAMVMRPESAKRCLRPSRLQPSR